MSILRVHRVLFTAKLAELIIWINSHPGWEVAIDEATVHSPRFMWVNGQKHRLEDAVHKIGSFHHDGRATDLILYIDGLWISDGDHPAWKAIAVKWESLHPLCTSGRRWNDGNHVSVAEGAKEGPLPL